VPLRKLFDYLPSHDCDLAALIPGTRVLVPFQRRQLVGIFMGTENQTAVPLDKLKSVEMILDPAPLLSPSILKLCQWAADYYHHPLGEVLLAALPKLLRQKKSIPEDIPPVAIEEKHSPHEALLLNRDQQEIIQAITTSLDCFSVNTIDGVTGSGKTEVYLQIIQKLLDRNQQILVLVPEISLTPQTIKRFRERFSVPIVTLHSQCTEKARLHAWLAARAEKASIVIGTRSAIFTPLPRLGAIIVDEEHDPSFKQHDGFRYHARDLAIWRAHDTKIPVILGSATPSLETLHRSFEGRYRYFNLPERAGGANLPNFHIIDVRRQFLEEGLSQTLLKEIGSHLNAGNQVLLFLNRRGFSPVMLCHACGWMAECPHCDMRLTYHLHPKRLQCHSCDASMPVPQACAKCGDQEVTFLGMGTEKLELALQKHFPDTPIARLDRDSTRRKGTMEKVLKDIQNGVCRLLIGTQMIAKGHHFPNVTLVGIIDSDYGLFSSDFRASERLGQLILQVAGRAGRAMKPGAVWIQTHHPEHPLLQLLTQRNYQQFAKSLLLERQSAALPPFTSLALFHAEAHQAQDAEHFLNHVKKIARSLDQNISVQGPVPAIMARRAGRHRLQLLMQTPHRQKLQQFLRRLLVSIENFSTKRRIHWAVDVDPVELT